MKQFIKDTQDNIRRICCSHKGDCKNCPLFTGQQCIGGKVMELLLLGYEVDILYKSQNNKEGK